MIEMYSDIFNTFNHLKNPYLMVLVGPPLSGKSTFIKHFKSHCIMNGLDSFEVISRDAILLETYGSNNYSLAWKNVDQKLVDKTLKERIESLSNSNTNVIIDMTNMTSNGRKNNNDKFTNYYKVAVILKFDLPELLVRNEKRKLEENKYIPTNVINSMIDSFAYPSLEEGFDFIIKL